MRLVSVPMLRMERMCRKPISPVAVTCVPPHSSFEMSSTATTRTIAPYFSPKNANAPVLRASSMGMTSVRTGTVGRDEPQYLLFQGPAVVVAKAAAKAEVEMELVGHDLGTLLLDGRVDRAQSRLKKMGRRMCPRDRRPPLRVHVSTCGVSRGDGTFEQNAFVDDQPFHGSLRVRDLEARSLCRDEPRVADLAALLTVERGR